jgi:hypothetical protein
MGNVHEHAEHIAHHFWDHTNDQLALRTGNGFGC